MSPRNRNERQFDEYREWQWSKHLALGEYVWPWAMKVGSRAQEIVVADCFAGAGSYPDAVTGRRIDGSPPIFAARARAYMQTRPGKSMHVICVERNGKNFAALKERMAEFEDYTTLLRGDFSRHRETVLERMGNSPALILLDPIGLKTIPADVCAPLLTRTAKTDVFIVLHFKVVHRTGGMLLPTGHANPAVQGSEAAAANLDATFGGPRWRFVACTPGLTAEERERKYVDIYFEDVLGSRYGYKCAFPVRRRFVSAVQYWLVQASDSLDAFLLMNDEIVKLNELLLYNDYDPAGSLEGFAAWEVEQHRDRELGALKSAAWRFVAAAPGGGAPFGTLRDALLKDFFGRVKQGAYSKAVKALVKEGKLGRQERLAAAIKDGELITLGTQPPPGERQRDHRTVVPLRPAA